MNRKKQFTEGLVTNNPVLVQQIGMCATMAITTTLFNGVGMGLSVLIILTCCNVVISAIRKMIPGEIRLAIFVVVIAGFVTIVDMLLKAFVPALSEALGVFIPLIVVNCIIIGRAEAFCQKMPVKDSFFDGIFQGVGYTRVLIAMCVIRELLGAGTVFGLRLLPESFGMTIFIQPPGAFLVFALIIAVMNAIGIKTRQRKLVESGCDGNCALCSTVCETRDTDPAAAAEQKGGADA